MRLFNCFREDTYDSLKKEIHDFNSTLNNCILDLTEKKGRLTPLTELMSEDSADEADISSLDQNEENSQAATMIQLKNHFYHSVASIGEAIDDASFWIDGLLGNALDLDTTKHELYHLNQAKKPIDKLWLCTLNENWEEKQPNNLDIDYLTILALLDESNFTAAESQAIARQGIDLVQRLERFLSEQARDDSPQESMFYLEGISLLSPSNSINMYESFSQEEDEGIVNFN